MSSTSRGKKRSTPTGTCSRSSSTCPGARCFQGTRSSHIVRRTYWTVRSVRRASELCVNGTRPITSCSSSQRGCAKPAFQAHAVRPPSPLQDAPRLPRAGRSLSSARSPLFVFDDGRAPGEVTGEQAGEPGVRLSKPLVEPGSQRGVHRRLSHPVRPLKSSWRAALDPEELDRLLIDVVRVRRVVLRSNYEETVPREMRQPAFELISVETTADVCIPPERAA